MQMEVVLTRCVITQGRRARRKPRLDTQCEQGGAWWGPSCEPPRNPQEAGVKAKQREGCGAQSLRCSFLWNKSRSWQKRHIAFHCLAWIEERGRGELGKETQTPLGEQEGEPTCTKAWTQGFRLRKLPVKTWHLILGEEGRLHLRATCHSPVHTLLPF